MPHATLHIIQKSRQICKVRQYAQCGEHRTSLEEKITLPLLKSTAAAAGAGAYTTQKSQSKRTGFSAWCTSRDSALVRLSPAILPAAKLRQPVPRCAWISRYPSGPSGPPWPRARDPGTLDPHHRADGVRALHVHKRMSRPSQGQLILWCTSRDSNPGPAD